MKFLAVLFLLICTPPNEEVVVSWSAENNLTWGDFKAEAKPNADEAALTASGITFGFSVRKSSEGNYVSFDSKVEAHFYPEKSWYVKERASSYILAHEQLHFDLTELYVRKLRHGISKLKISPAIKENLRALHAAANKELAEMQQQYDLETDHSRRIGKQAYWSAFVEKELYKLRGFASK